MSGSDSASSWSSFLSDLSLSEQNTVIYSENDFHRAFEKVCAELREREPQRLLAKFLRYHAQVIAFIGALDGSIGLDASNSLNSVFWSKAFAAVLTALKTHQNEALFRKYYPALSNAIPAFGADLSLFPDNEKVQKPLQSIFAEYLECYEVMLQQLGSSSLLALDSFLERVESTSQLIATYKKEWEENVKEATMELEAVRQSPTQFSYYNSSLGPLNPYTTRASFEWQETLGKGTYGEVAKVREMSTGTCYARKVINVANPSSKAQIEKDVLNEVSIMQKLRHHHIASVQFHTSEAEKYSIFMLPVADCDLRIFLDQCTDQSFPRTEVTHLTSWFGCLISALAFAHSNNVKHEDIKPSNILIKDHQPFLADFGCAKDFSGQESSTSQDTLTFGTPVYWAPDPQPRGRIADVFSLGCVFSEMLTVRQKRSLKDFQAFRYVKHRDNAYAFKENLEKVITWLDGMISPKDWVGILLKEETCHMLEPDQSRRKKAKDIKRSLRQESDAVFCSTCV